VTDTTDKETNERTNGRTDDGRRDATRLYRPSVRPSLRWSLTLTGTVIEHVLCHVTYHPGAKMVHISEIPDLNLHVHFVTFRALRRRLSHVIVENSVYPIVKATKFTAHAQYHVTCA